MSDFVQTMKDWRRMCKAQDDTTCGACSSCPMGDDGKSCMAVYEDEFVTVDFAHIEQTVTEWAAEHPEPVYPTWGEWLEAEGICFSRLTNYERIGGFSIPQVFDYQIDGKTAFMCGDKVNTPIPADTAQKLGLKPKEE